MGVSPRGHWEGLSTNLPRRQRPLTEDRRAAMEALLAKKQLDLYERGWLEALSRDGSAVDRERARSKLDPPATPTPSRVDDETLEAWADDIAKALDADTDRRR
jgi:hypothetical protein